MKPALIHATNAVAMWRTVTLRYGQVVYDSTGLAIFEPSWRHSPRVIVLGDGVCEPDPVRVIRRYFGVGRGSVLVEDPSGRHDFAGLGLAPRYRMPVMVLPPDGPAHSRDLVARSAPTCASIEVSAVDDERDYLSAEEIMAAVFPPTFRPGVVDAGPPSVLGIPGWQVWLGRRDGVPAAAASTFDDGHGIGVYKLATLPEYRGRGLARALMTAILRRYPARTVSLTATAAGAPLYLSLGFMSVSEAVWWAPPFDIRASGSDTGISLR